MKRFYCTICKRQVRVRRLPDNVELVQGPRGPIYSPGQCRHHNTSQSRSTLQERVRVHHTTLKRAPQAAPTPAPKPQSRGKGRGKGVLA